MIEGDTLPRHITSASNLTFPPSDFFDDEDDKILDSTQETIQVVELGKVDETSQVLKVTYAASSVMVTSEPFVAGFV